LRRFASKISQTVERTVKNGIFFFLSRVRDRSRGTLAMVRGADLLLYFGGLTSEETAAFLKMSQRTVEREKRIATAWLYWPLSGQEADET